MELEKLNILLKLLKSLANQKINVNIKEMDENNVKAKRVLNNDISDLSNELTIVSDKVNTMARDLRSTDEKAKIAIEKIEVLDGDLKKIEIKLTKLKTKVDSIPPNED